MDNATKHSLGFRHKTITDVGSLEIFFHLNFPPKSVLVLENFVALSLNIWTHGHNHKISPDFCPHFLVLIFSHENLRRRDVS